MELSYIALSNTQTHGEDGLDPGNLTIIHFSILETYLRLWCDAVGLDFQDSMINWKSLTEEQLQQFEPLGDWVKTAKNSDRFLQTSTSPVDMSMLPEEIKICIQEAMPHYEKLYALRLEAQ